LERCPVTAEAAGSSPVVPAILFKHLGMAEASETSFPHKIPHKSGTADLFLRSWHQNWIGIQQLNRFACSAACDVCVVTNHACAPVAHDWLNASQGNPEFHHVGNERMPQVMEPEAGESRLFCQAGPGSIPIPLVLSRIVATFAFVLPVRDAAQMLRHQVM